MNTSLAALYDHAQRNIEALEAKATVRARKVDQQIADLRRRRRMAEASDDARAIFTEIIVELETENDQAMAQLARQRAALRRKADATEEALWQRIDVLIEVEPLYLVRWRAKDLLTVSYLLSPERLKSSPRSALGSAMSKVEHAAWLQQKEKERREIAAKEKERVMRAIRKAEKLKLKKNRNGKSPAIHSSASLSSHGRQAAVATPPKSS